MKHYRAALIQVIPRATVGFFLGVGTVLLAEIIVEVIR